MSEFLKSVAIPLVNVLSKTLNISLENAVKGVSLGIKKCINDMKEEEIEEKKVSKSSDKSDKKEKKVKSEKKEKKEKKCKKSDDSDCNHCEYKFQRSPKKGQICGSRVDKNSEKFCSKHIKKENEKVKPVVEKKTKIVEKVKTQKRIKTQELSAKLKTYVDNVVSYNRGSNSPFIRVERNKYGNYQCLDDKISRFLIDPQTLEIVGIQKEEGDIQELSKEDIEICKELNYHFKIPLSLSDRQNEEHKSSKSDRKEEEIDIECESCYDESECESECEM